MQELETVVAQVWQIEEILEFYNEYGDDLLQSGPLSIDELDDDAVQRLFNDQWTRTVMLKINDQIVAAAQICARQTFRRFVGTVEYVLVGAPWRGLGLSKLLMTELHKQARDMGCTKMELVSGVHLEAAHGLYRKMGYTLVKDSKTHFQMDL